MNVLLCFYSPIISNRKSKIYSFHESLIKGFQSIGIKPYVMVTNDFLCDPFCGEKNDLLPHIRVDVLKDYIKSLNLDLVVTLNNSKPDFIEEICDCPIIVLDADAPITFNDKETLKANRHRYHFGYFSTYGKVLLEDAFSSDIKSFHAQYGTEIKSSGIFHPKRNIGFVGTYFHVNPHVLHTYVNHPEFVRELYNAYKQDHNFDFDAFCEARNFDAKQLGFKKETGLRGVGAAQKRNQIIAAVAPLGLELRGSISWVQIANFSEDAFWGFNPEPIFAFDDLQEFYNTSCVSINTSHDQIVSGYSWRVLDIMASNSVMVSDYSSDLAAAMPKHLLQFYSTPQEAHKICQYLLEHEDERIDIVRQSNEVIDRKFRWKHLLPHYLEEVGLKYNHDKIMDINVEMEIIPLENFTYPLERKIRNFLISSGSNRKKKKSFDPSLRAKLFIRNMLRDYAYKFYNYSRYIKIMRGGHT